MKNISTRYEELDALRAFAMIGVILYHLGFDLQFYYNIDLYPFHLMWSYIGPISASLFIILAGISFSLNDRPLHHGSHILWWAMVITFITALYAPDYTIHFGILHCIGISILFSIPFKKHIRTYACFLIPIILALYYHPFPPSETWWLLPLNIAPPSYSSFDYYPLIPWYALFLCGTFLGATYYPHPPFQLKISQRFLQLGRHTLWIYLIHQPILLIILYGIY